MLIVLLQIKVFFPFQFNAFLAEFSACCRSLSSVATPPIFLPLFQIKLCWRGLLVCSHRQKVLVQELQPWLLHQWQLYFPREALTVNWFFPPAAFISARDKFGFGFYISNVLFLDLVTPSPWATKTKEHILQKKNIMICCIHRSPPFKPFKISHFPLKHCLGAI